MCQSTQTKSGSEAWNPLSSTELLLHIFSYLDSPDLCRCARVCTYWEEVSEDHTLWRGLCTQHNFPVATMNQLTQDFKRQSLESVEVVPSSNGPTWIGSWKDAFNWFHKCKHLIFKEGDIKNGHGSFTWTFNPSISFTSSVRSVQQQLDLYFSQKKLQISCTFEGEWKGDMPHGLGCKVWSDGASFVGYWDTGKFHGYGTHSWASGNKYEGMWKNHMRNGLGSNTWPQKDCYEGQWLDDQKDGYGVYKWPDGRRYEGYWKKDKRNGMGTYYWSRMGCKYTGNWEDDRRQGMGRFYWSDGDFFEGEWQNGRRKGTGKFYSKNLGKVYQQSWDEKDFDSKSKGDLTHELNDEVYELPTKRKFAMEDDDETRVESHSKKPKCKIEVAAN